MWVGVRYEKCREVVWRVGEVREVGRGWRWRGRGGGIRMRGGGVA